MVSLHRHLKNPKETLEFMLRPKITSLPGHIQSVYVQNIPKLYARIVKEAEDEDDNDTVKEVTQMMLEKLPMFVQSSDLEVQERVRNIVCIIVLWSLMDICLIGNHTISPYIYIDSD